MATEQSELSVRQFGGAVEIYQNSSSPQQIANHTLAHSFRPVGWEKVERKKAPKERVMIFRLCFSTDNTVHVLFYLIYH